MAMPLGTFEEWLEHITASPVVFTGGLNREQLMQVYNILVGMRGGDGKADRMKLADKLLDERLAAITAESKKNDQ